MQFSAHPCPPLSTSTEQSIERAVSLRRAFTSKSQRTILHSKFLIRLQNSPTALYILNCIEKRLHFLVEQNKKIRNAKHIYFLHPYLVCTLIALILAMQYYLVRTKKLTCPFRS